MLKRITIPDLGSTEALRFSTLDIDLEGISEVKFDYLAMTNFEPFGMLVMTQNIKRILNQHKDIKFQTSNHKHHEYASHIGYFKASGFDYGKNPGEAHGSSTYIPITKITVRDLNIQAHEHAEAIQNTIERQSRKLADILSNGNDTLSTVLSYSIRELMRNIVEHSTSSEIWIAAQKWPNLKKVEIAILDKGVGIKQAISVNPNLNISSTSDALRVAIEPGISGKAFTYKGKKRGVTNSPWDNSGFGLFVTSKLCQYGGEFLLASNDAGMRLRGSKSRFFDCDIEGTAIKLKLDIEKIETMGPTLINQIVTMGEDQAKKNSKHSIITASKVSRIEL
ncbi:hypothetical protein ASG65_20875 [Bacillus sp. Leaf13]|nr:hypothetical protein ASG65_20875 [Bacillus sp. Leaf13]